MNGERHAREIAGCVVAMVYVLTVKAYPLPDPWGVVLAVAVCWWAARYADQDWPWKRRRQWRRLRNAKAPRV